jgi:hypothetical protein
LDTAGDVADEFVVGGRILTNLSNWIAAQWAKTGYIVHAARSPT